MITTELIVSNKAGIHARPANLIAKTAQKFDSKITLSNREIEANAKSIMGVITLGATKGTKLILKISGDDERLAEEEIRDIFEKKFFEEEND